jgi:hypothetical protein
VCAYAAVQLAATRGSPISRITSQYGEMDREKSSCMGHSTNDMCSCAEMYMPLAREEVVAHIGNIKSANNSKVSYCPIVWNHHEVEACHIIVDEIWRDHSPEVEEVGVGFFDFIPHSLENSWLHFVVVPSKLLTIEFLYICVVLVELTLISNHLHSLAGRCGVATWCLNDQDIRAHVESSAYRKSSS